MEYTLRILKPNAVGGRDIKDIPLTGIEEILTPEEIFQMELKLNENLPHLRFHIESRDKP